MATSRYGNDAMKIAGPVGKDKCRKGAAKILAAQAISDIGIGLRRDGSPRPGQGLYAGKGGTGFFSSF
jgi:hypothetical protein